MLLRTDVKQGNFSGFYLNFKRVLMKRFIIGLLISGILSYFAFKGVDWRILKESLIQLDYRYLLPIILLNLLVQWMRSYRWGLILKPLQVLDQRTLFSVTSVGFMGILLLPARIGEFLRPYLISQKKQIDLRSALATVVVERVFDGLTIMGFFVWVILFVPLPAWVHRAGYLSLAVFLSTLLLLLFTLKQKEGTLKLVHPLVKVLPKKAQDTIRAFIHSFAQGLQILPDWKNTILVAGLSLAIWALMGLIFYISFYCTHFKLPLIAAYVVLTITVIGIMIPGAPGFVGNFHLFCVLGLSLFGIPRSEALTYAIITHLIQALSTIVLGIIFLPSVNISWPYLSKSGNR
jgi:glycosyltransferase 2 family protein